MTTTFWRSGIISFSLAAVGYSFTMGGCSDMPVSAGSGNNALEGAAPSAPAERRPPKEYLVYVGTYTQKKSKGIYALRMDAETGKLTPVGLVAETENPSYLAIHPNGKYLYATNEVGNFQGTKSGAISAFSIDAASGKLTFLNQETSKGDAPCDICLDPAGKFVMAANYGGGSVVVLPVQSDGKLGAASGFMQHKGSSVNKQRQEGPHAHSVGMDPAGKYLYVSDLGLDKVFIYRVQPGSGALTLNDHPSGQTAPGAGPRHFKLHPNGRFGYVIDELDSTITAFRHDPETGALENLQVVSTLPADAKVENNPAELVIHPSGKFLYGSNRGHDSLVICSINPETGKLKVVGYQSTMGKNPRNFAIDPSGRFLLAANQDTDNIVVFQIDQETGKLTQSGDQVEISMPVCLVFLPASGG
jgi:6-phosphogluconolactonase